MFSIADLKIAVIELGNKTLALNQYDEKKLLVLKLNNNFLKFSFTKKVSDKLSI